MSLNSQVILQRNRLTHALHGQRLLTCLRPDDPLPDIDHGFFTDGISEIRTRDKCRLTLNRIYNEIDIRMHFMASGYSLVFDLPTPRENPTVIFFVDEI